MAQMAWLTALVASVALCASPAFAIGNNKGSWSPVKYLPLVPVSVAVLPGNKLLMFSAWLADGFGGNYNASPDQGTTLYAIMDLNTGAVTSGRARTGHDMFCPATTILADGRLLVNGGSNALETSIFDPRTNTWKAAAKMKQARAYNADTILTDGRVFTLGGSWSGGTAPKDGEAWTEATGWVKLPGIKATEIYTADPQGQYRADNHGWFFAIGGNKVFHAGPSKKMHFFDTSGAGSSRFAGYRAADPDAMNGCAVMVAPGRILTTGGAKWYTTTDATSNTHLITLSGDTLKSVEKLPSMSFRRAFHNMVVLPNGEVIVVGGMPFPTVFVDAGGVLTPEIWNPTTRTWRTLNNMKNARNYHSTAVLLPDGRVFVGGGGLCNKIYQTYCPGNTVNHKDYEVLTPPYLLNPDGSPVASRPGWVSIPGTVTPGTKITVQTNKKCTSFSMVRCGATTHTVNNDQRRVPLVYTVVNAATNTYSLTIPPAASGVLPGYWLFFAMDINGVPSYGRFVRVTITTPMPAFQASTARTNEAPSGQSTLNDIPQGIKPSEYQRD